MLRPQSKTVVQTHVRQDVAAAQVNVTAKKVGRRQMLASCLEPWPTHAPSGELLQCFSLSPHCSVPRAGSTTRLRRALNRAGGRV